MSKSATNKTTTSAHQFCDSDHLGDRLEVMTHGNSDRLNKSVYLDLWGIFL